PRGAGGGPRAPAAGDRPPWVVVVGCGHGRRRPAVLQIGGQAVRELAQVPRSGHVEGEEARREVLVDVRHLGVARARREPALEQVEVEHERLAHGRTLEVAVAVVVAQQLRSALEGEDDGWLPLAERKQDREAVATLPPTHPRHGVDPGAPRARWLGDPRGGEEVSAVEEGPRVDGPRHSPGGAVYHVRVQDAGEDVVPRRR